MNRAKGATLIVNFSAANPGDPAGNFTNRILAMPRPWKWAGSVALLTAALLCLMVSPARAQDTGSVEPGAVQEHSHETQEYYELQKKLSEEKKNQPAKNNITDQTGNAPMPVSPAAGPSFLLKEVVTDKSAILTPEEIRSVTRKYEQKQATIKDLIALTQELNQLYRSKGAVSARAFLLPQEVQGGIVKIRLVEARVGKIVVENDRHTRESFFDRRISLKPGDLVEVGKLQRDLTFLNATTDVKVKAILQPGGKPETTDVVLKVEEPDNLAAFTFFDNAGRDTIGRQRVGISARDSSLLGYRDSLSGGVYRANGTFGEFATYSLPFGSRGTRAEFNFDRAAIKIKSGQLRGLGITGDSNDLNVRLVTPLMVKTSVIFRASITPHFKTSKTASNNFLISQIREKTVEAGGDLQVFDKHGFWYSTNYLEVGWYKLLGNHDFTKYNGSITRLQVFPDDYLGILRANWQFKLQGANSLLPIEQEQIGGVASVRGYPEGWTIGDNGYVVSAELDCPLPFADHKIHRTPMRKLIKGALFVDHGELTGLPKSNGIHSANSVGPSLTSVGWGAIFNVSKYFTTRLNWGVPLENRNGISKVGFSYYVQPNLSLPFLLRKAAGHGSRQESGSQHP